MGAHFDLFLSTQNFRLAFKRLQTANKSFYKSIYYQDWKIFGLFVNENIDCLVSNIKQQIYEPTKSYKVYIPKKNNLVRPISVLVFTDLLVYQAIVNVIADSSYDTIAPFYNEVIFNSEVNPTITIDNNIFFFKSWKSKWKKFNETSRSLFSKGFIYISEFDIASFFDSIDHKILYELLSRKHKIDTDLLDLLSKCLEAWTCDSSYSSSFSCRHGIPQGPICSTYLADIYMLHLDTEVRKIPRSLEFKYIRYVDDIRIFAKNELTGKKIIAYLDLYARDLGLIPQGDKIATREIKDINRELNLQFDKFSDITKEYKKDNEGKPAGQLRAKTHRKLKEDFLTCFNEASNNYLNKTIIKFALFKLNRDEEIKEILLKEYNLIQTHFDELLFYLKKHYFNDPDVKTFVVNIINDENILFHYLIALVFKHFHELEFNESVYSRYTTEKHRYWLINYYMIQWLYNNGKIELIALQDPGNFFVQREINSFRYIASEEKSFKRIFSQKLLENPDDMIALQGLYLLSNNIGDLLKVPITSRFNKYIENFFTKQPPDIINYTLRNDWKVEDSESFFNNTLWNEENSLNELRTSFLIFYKSINNDASKSLMNLNSFNELIFDKICQLKSIDKPGSYGDNLNSEKCVDFLPTCKRYWREINDKRNQKTDAHPYDKYGNIRIKITQKEFLELIEKEKNTIRELVDFPEW